VVAVEEPSERLHLQAQLLELQPRVAVLVA
jgi:hypothetical protein